MKLLLTNDDGVDAQGIAALSQAVASLGEPVVVAPSCAHSGCSHRVTAYDPIRVVERHSGCFVVEGTPADCVRVGLSGIAPDTDWIVSGINEGGNLGVDVFHSGTVAAVREGVFHGKPGIAVSHFNRKELAIDWTRAAGWVTPVLADLIARPWLPGTFWNINLPHLEPGDPDPEIVFCPLDLSPLPVSFHREGDLWRYNGKYHHRSRRAGSDVEVCFGGRIAVSLIRLV